MNITVKRDPNDICREWDGSYRHPDLPQFYPDEDRRASDWAQRHGFQVRTVKERLVSEDFEDWDPEPPEGEGWFTLEVKKTGGIASWTWAKRVTP